MTYPKVVGEHDTVREVLTGKSLARIGDGELKILEGRGYVREMARPELTAEMRRIARRPHPNCLVGIPTMDPAGDRFFNWKRLIPRFERQLGSIRYYSAFVSRPDCGTAWLENAEYARLVQQIWRDRGRVCVVSTDDNKLLTAVRLTNKVTHVPCPEAGAYAVIGKLQKAALKSRCDLVLISCGPTATCLAHRLCPKVQAVDLGSVGAFLLRYLD